MKSVRVFVIFMTLLFLGSCKDEPEKAVPPVLLSESQMVDVMVDIQLMESAINIKKNTGNKITYLRTRGFDTIFSHYGVTDSIFIENYNYYSSDPQMILRIMDSVVVRLTKMPVEQDNVCDTINKQ